MIDLPVFTGHGIPVTAALLCAFAVSVLLVLTKQHHGHLTMDLNGVVPNFQFAAPASRELF